MARLLKGTEETLNNITKELKKLLNSFDVTESKVMYKLPTIDRKCTVFIPMSVQRKINALVDNCKKEIAWHVLVQRVQEDVFQVSDIIMFPQAVTGAAVTSDDAEYTKWIMSLDDNTFNKLKGHMHSHVNMGVSPSGIDTKYQNQVAQNEEDFYLFAIWNKKGDNWFRVIDVKNNILYDDTDIILDTDITSEDSWAKEMITQYVTEEFTVSDKQLNMFKDWKSIAEANEAASDWAKFIEEELNQNF